MLEGMGPPLEQLAKYRLLKPISRGGMGEVFLARHEGPVGFSKTVVIKRARAELARDPRFVRMFLHEARIAAELNHPNVVQVFELGEADGSYFIAMEYVPGHSLRAVTSALAEQGQVLEPHCAARIGAEALRGLSHAHTLADRQGKSRGLVHCDVSPDNILISFDGSVKVVDFGLARLLDSLEVGEPPRAGKLPYMAPEQLRGERLDARTDLFAMGVVLYELVTGVRPFDDDHAAHDVLPRAPRKRQSSLPRRLDPIILRALAPTAEGRFASAAQMADALERFLERSGKRVGPVQLAGLMRELFGSATEAPETLEPEDARPRTEPLPSRERGEPALLESQLLPRDAVVPGARPLPEPRRAQRRWLAASAVLALAGAGGWGLRQLLVDRAIVAAVAVLPREPPPPTGVPTVLPLPAQDAAPVTRAPLPEPLERTPPRRPSRASVPTRKVRGHGAAMRESVLVTGTVTLLVHPWADVFYQGKQLGQTPLSPFELPAGKVTLTLVNEELSIREDIHLEVLAGKTVTQKVDLFDVFARRHGAAKTP